MATVTHSFAMSTFVPPAHHHVNSIRGERTGAISISGQANFWMAKIPPNAKNVQVHALVDHAGAALQHFNFGVRHGASASATVSAFGEITASTGINGVLLSAPYSPSWDDAGGERHKYVIASLQAGTVTVSTRIRFTITYDMHDR